MSLNKDYKEEYKELLKKALVTIVNSNKYGEVFKRYSSLKKKIDKALLDAGALATDAEPLIDKKTGDIKPGAEAAVGTDTDIMNMLSELAALYRERMRFENFGWHDDLRHHIDSVIAIGVYRDMEKKILSELGRDAGQLVIYEAKTSVLSFERELGIDLFAVDVERMRDLFRIKRLFPADSEIKLTNTDNLDEERIILKNADGERFNFEKAAEMRYLGSVYLELELLEDLKVGKFNYYKLERTSDGQMLTLVEDENTDKNLEKVRDALCVKFQR